MDRDILRELAGKVASIAALDVQQEIARLYRAINNLKMIRPVVLVDELPWNQLNGGGELTLHCEDPFLRGVELNLRRLLYRWNHQLGDLFIDRQYILPRAISIGNMGFTVQEETLAPDKGNHIVSHHYFDQLKDWEDIEKFHMPEINVDDACTQRQYEILNGIFGDLLPIRVTGVTHAGFYMPWDNLAMWRGVGPIYYDLTDRPEFLHAIMRRFVDIRKALLQKLEDMDLLDDYMPILHCTPGLVDDLPGDKPDGRVTRRNLWGRGTAQMFDSVSPAMHDEFEIQYAKEFFEGFGLLYYGCCEPLHNKIDIVSKLPNVRKLSITPWANVPLAAERMGRRYVLSRKPNPAAVATPALDVDTIRKDILETLDACHKNGTSCEFILKDISTVNYQPEKLTQWTKIVKETILNY